jgi:inner membrane protein
MATVFAHAAAAGALSCLGPQRVSRGRLAVVLSVVAVVPDLDVIGFWYGIDYAHPLGHRGFTHSIVFALFLGGTVPFALFGQVRAGTSTWWLLAGLVSLATLSHGVLDALTNGGLGVGFLIPFDDTRYFAPWRPVAVSPLSISAFFSGSGLRILANEALWVGLPVLALVGVSLLTRARPRPRRVKQISNGQ